MCGIAGFIARSGKKQNDSLEAMVEALKHRGPDGRGFSVFDFSPWSVHLGHARLSIIDIEGGKQPMTTPDGKRAVTFNGEIFNFRKLRRTLEGEGAPFLTRSDTEVILQHYARFGSSGLKDLNGMFAFALWDGQKEELVLARDRAGVKPLYYAVLPNGGMAFASELTALMKHPDVARQVDPEALRSFFFSDYVQSPQSIIKGVRKLEPGHWLVWKNGQISKPQAFWVLGKSERTQNGHEPEELWEKMSVAVERQLVADVPVGIFLSGGVDSSIVSVLARQKIAGRLQTFSIGFKEKSFDESAHARLLAKHIGSIHTEEILSQEAMLQQLDAALDCLDEPLADPSLLPTYILSKLASGHVKVVLGGDGGDELWGGYPTYRAHRYGEIYKKLPEIFRKTIFPHLTRALPVKDTYQSFEWKAKRFAEFWDDDPVKRHLRWMSNTDIEEVRLAVGGEKDPLILEKFHGTSVWRDMNRFLALDFQTYLPGSVLMKVDRASMAHGLEVRPPFLDNEMIDYAFSVPSDLKIKGGGKHLLKLAARGYVPQVLLDRPKKGFGIPLAQLMKGALSKRLGSVLAESPLWGKGNLLNRQVFERWQGEHLAGKIDRSKSLWAMIVLDHWAKRLKIVF